MNRIIPNRPASPGFAVGLAIALQAGLACRAPGPATRRPLILVARSSFMLNSSRRIDRRAGMGASRCRPVTNAWTRIAEYPIKNGVTAMARFRVSPDGTRSPSTNTGPRLLGRRELGLAPRSPPGRGTRKISDIGGRPIWSPDGKHLLVVKVMTSGLGHAPRAVTVYATWKIDADGSHPVRLPIPGTDQVTDWSSDGRWLVAYSRIPGKEANSPARTSSCTPMGRAGTDCPGRAWDLPPVLAR